MEKFYYLNQLQYFISPFVF